MYFSTKPPVFSITNPQISLMVKLIIGTLLCFILAAPSWAEDDTKVYNIKGNLPDLTFKLQSAHGTVTEKDVRGKIAMVFFGYASCPDICPTTMAELSQLKQSLSPQLADKIQIVFISVDPHRDTPAILQAYVDAFKNGAIGLTGTTEQIADIAKRYRVAYQISKPAPGAAENNYEVMHAQGVYIFDEQGKARLLASNASDTLLIKSKLEELLSQ